MTSTVFFNLFPAILVSVVVASAAHAVPPAGTARRPADATGTVVVPDQFLRRWDPVTIFFARDVGPAQGGPEDRASRWVTFAPAHPGAFRWLDARTLQFRPADPWPPLARFTWSADNQSVTVATLMAAPTSTVPAAETSNLDRVGDITLSFAEPIDPRDLARMVTIELRPLPGSGTTPGHERSRWLTHHDYTIKSLERRSRSDVATYVLHLENPIDLGTRAIVHVRLSLDDEATTSFAEVAFSTAEPFRIATVGCRSFGNASSSSDSARRSYPIAPNGSRYSQDQALRCGTDRQVLIELSAKPREISPVDARNLVRFAPPVDELRFSTEGNALVVSGAFAWDTTYRVGIEPSPLTDERNRPLELHARSELYVYFPEPARFLTWVAPHGVAEQLGPQMVPVNGRGQERLDLRVYPIDPLNRALWPFPDQAVSIDESQRPPGPGEEPGVHDQVENPSIEEIQLNLSALGSPPVSTLVPLPLRRNGGSATFGLDLAPHLARIAGQRRPGSYLVGLRRIDSSSERSWMRLQVTDLSLTTVEEPRAVRFIVTSLSSGRPVAGATIRIEGALNTRWTTFAEGTTGTDGSFAWRAPGPTLQMVTYTVGRIVVQHEGDTLVLDPDRAPDGYTDNLWAPTRERWLQWAYQSLDYRGPQAKTLCHIFTERPVYRPEEEVHIKGYVRHLATGQLRPDMLDNRPAALIIEGPGDQEWRREVTITPYGSLYDQFAEPNLPTGDYTVHLENWKKEKFGHVSFRMEAYRIPTFQVDLHGPDKTPLDRNFSIDLTASYYAGGKVAGRPVLWRVTQFPYAWSPKTRPGFFYSSDARFAGGKRFESSPKLEQQETTDESGAARLVLNPAIEPTAQPRTYIVEATVTGADDQTVTNTKHINALPPFTLGLKVPRYLETAAALAPQVIVVGPDGELLPGIDVTVRLLNRQWHSHLRASDFSNGAARYVTDIVDEKVSETKVVSGTEPVTLSLPLASAGVYVVELEAHDKLSRAQVVSVDLYAGGTEAVTWAKPATRVFEVATDKESYDPGETAAIVLKSPYQEGRALAVVEAPQGNTYQWLDVTGGSATFRQAIDKTHMPRLPVHFILMRGRVGDTTPRSDATTDLGKPATMAATAWLTVNPIDNRVDVALENPPRARPGDTIPVTIRLASPQGSPLPGEATLWLVDQAVLALGKEQRLDPVPDFIAEVKSHLTVRDTRNWAFGFLPFAEAPGGSGDGEAERLGAFDKVTIRRTFKPVPYFNPSIEVGPDGVARVEVQLPDNLTNFKLRAKAISGPDRFGYGTGEIAVRLPVVVQPALPRFVRPGDTFTASALGRVIEGEAGPGQAAIQLDGVDLTVPAQQDIVFTPDQPQRVGFPVEVTTPAYTADGKLARADVTFRFAVKRLSDGAGDAVEVKLPVRDDRARVTTRVIEDLQSGVALPVPALDEAPRPGTVRRSVLVSDQPALVRMAAGLDYLLAYPYGCTEQKLSRARAYLALKSFRALLDQEAPDRDTARPITEMLELLPQVIDNRGLCAYWPGSTGSVSLTAWVLQFLVEARAAGYPVDSALHDSLVRALEQALRSDYSNFIDGEAFVERAWALTALSSAGKSNPAYAAELARRSRYLDIESTAQVALALAEGGDTTSSVFTDLIDKMWNGLVIRLYQGKEIYGGLQKARQPSGLVLPSETRTVAEVTRAVSRIDSNAPRLQVLVNALVTLGRGDGWGSTNASAAALTALSAFMQPPYAGSTARTVKLRIGAEEQHLSIGPDAAIAKVVSTNTEPGDIVLQPGAAGTVVARMETSYVPLADGSQVSARSDGFVVTRELLRVHPDGETPSERIALAQAGSAVALAIGDVIEDHVQVVNPVDRHYVAIAVPLAAGMEPLNPRLATASSVAKPSTPLTQEPSYAAYQDDSVTFFYDTLPRGTFDLYFRTRATTPGRFIQPAAQAEMMYDESVRGNSFGTVVEVGE